MVVVVVDFALLGDSNPLMVVVVDLVLPGDSTLVVVVENFG